MIDTAVLGGSRLSPACDALQISTRTYRRWKQDTSDDKRKGAKKKIPRKLTENEKNRIIQEACSDRFVDCNPYEIVSILLDEGIYIASPSSFYRVLRSNDMIHHRRKGKPGTKRSKPPALLATGPNQVWSWDITYLKSPVNGLFYYAYVIVDVWSRKIVGWKVHDRESSELAEQLFQDLKSTHQLKGIRLHSDNGNPMKGGTMLATLYQLGVMPSFSRPRVSDDNPFSEALFKTLKYTAGYPKCFIDLNHARSWMARFVDWYNVEHRHSQIGYITPSQRHSGLGDNIMKKRNTIMTEAQRTNPQRWSSPLKVWETPKEVTLNPDRKSEIKDKVA